MISQLVDTEHSPRDLGHGHVGGHSFRVQGSSSPGLG